MSETSAPKAASKEDIRAARLRALGLASEEKPAAESAEEPEQKRQMTHRSVPLTEVQFQVLRAVTFPPHAAEDDLQRWHSQGFAFSQAWGFGLKQAHGGPCGVLAAVQAEIIRDLLFKHGPLDEFPEATEETARQTLARAMYSVLARAAAREIVMVVPGNPEEPLDVFSPSSAYAVTTCDDEAQTCAVIEEHMAGFGSPVGVLLFVYSLLLTRGIDGLHEDMDDEEVNLTGQFGHCSQELINLLLTGHATSNVVDGSVPMGDTGLTIKGVLSRPPIGYLTQLEALRYLTVGSYYKIPELPIWVIGSQSHFTVLCSPQAEVNQETEAEQLLSSVRRAWISVDAEQSGFIATEQLRQVVRELNLPFVDNTQVMGQLRDKIQMDGVIVWSNFWITISQIMSGTPLDQVFGSGAVVSTTPQTTNASRPRSDSDIARELQAAWDAEGAQPMDIPTPQQPQQPQRPRTDSDIARELQAQFDSEFGDAAPGPAPAPATAAAAPATTSSATTTDPTMGSPMIHRHDSVADDSADCFTMFHYNGLETATRTVNLVQFRLYRRAAGNAIGQAVPLSSAPTSESSAHACPIEAVLKTRWEGCRLDWLGQQPPSID